MRRFVEAAGGKLELRVELPDTDAFTLTGVSEIDDARPPEFPPDPGNTRKNQRLWKATCGILASFAGQNDLCRNAA